MHLQPSSAAAAAPDNNPHAPAATVQWQEAGSSHSARWRSEAGVAAPRRLEVVDDTLNADAAYRLACEGTALLWRGDFHNARQLLQALGRRLDKSRRTPSTQAGAAAAAFPEAFHRHRMAQAQRARVLGQVLIPLEPGHAIALRRAPDVREACREAWGPSDIPALVALRELLGLVGAHEWRKKGVPVAALGGAHIHPHYGVFSPVRGEYVQLVAQAPLPAGGSEAWDIGTGTGVLAAVLAQRGVKQVRAIDQDPRALACASDNLKRLGLLRQVQVQPGDLYPEGQTALVVCNPPWLPAKPSAPIENAVYDPDSRMLRGFLAGLRAHLLPGGEGWLILSDLAEHLQLRSRAELQAWIDAAGLRVLGRLDAKPVHRKAQDAQDPLHPARAAEITSLWRLGAAV